MHTSADAEPALVLVVDDDLDMAMMLGEFVLATGVHVECASDFDGFLAVAQRGPRLLMLDLLMPEQCSERVIDWLAEHARDTVLILVSSLPLVEIERRAQIAVQQGIASVSCLRKPCWPRDVAALLQRTGLTATDTCVR
jgi:CheY-like chemotaxis protein